VKRFLISLGIALLLVALIAGAIIAGTVFQVQQLKARQDSLIAKYGVQVLTLCKTPPTTGKPKTAKGKAKLLVVNTLDSTVYEPFQNALNDTLRATSADDLTTLICLTGDHHSLGEDSDCAYHGTSQVLHRFANDLHLTAIDIASAHTVLDDITLPGTDPGDCPEKVSVSDNGSLEQTDLQGAAPTPEDFVDLINRTNRLTS
jgi:hypothetical protein